LGETISTATTGTLTFSTEASSASNVGTYSITGSGLTANHGNYIFQQAIPAGCSNSAGRLTVNPATLYYTADLVTRKIHVQNPALTGTVDGFLLDDTISNATTGTLIFSTKATTSSRAGEYAIVGSGLTANNGNYIFKQAASNATALTITP
jgi:hypothetical protein